MEITQFQILVILLAMLGVVSERVVEIIKSLVPGWNKENPDETQECKRKAKLQLFAVVVGILVALLAYPVLIELKQFEFLIRIKEGSAASTIIAIGFLASGGSGLWNAILTYLTKVKDLKSVAVEEKQLAVDKMKSSITQPPAP